MNLITAQTKSLFTAILLVCVFNAHSQSIQKDTIYLYFNHYKDNCIYKDLEKDLKINNRRGIQFNLCGKAILFYKNIDKLDTLCYKHIDDYNISTIVDIEKKVREFRYKTYKKMPKNKNEKLYQAYDKNDIFITFLIEKINNKQFVIYPVTWRNTRVTY